MADIKQAALWMQEGSGVRRAKWPPVYRWKEHRSFPMVELHCPDKKKQDAIFGLEDLLADDWELVSVDDKVSKGAADVKS